MFFYFRLCSNVFLSFSLIFNNFTLVSLYCCQRFHVFLPFPFLFLFLTFSFFILHYFLNMHWNSQSLRLIPSILYLHVYFVGALSWSSVAQAPTCHSRTIRGKAVCMECCLAKGERARADAQLGDCKRTMGGLRNCRPEGKSYSSEGSTGTLGGVGGVWGGSGDTDPGWHPGHSQAKGVSTDTPSPPWGLGWLR